MDSKGSDFQRLYGHRFDEREREKKDAVWKVIVEARLQAWVAPTDTVLDIGCGFGEFLNHVRCARRIGIDVNPESAAALDQDVEFHRAEAPELVMLPDASVDVVFTSNFMEHLSGKPAVERLIEEVWRVLVPGGAFIALGPNVRVVPASYWDFWDHFVPISERSLTEVLETKGFSVVDCYPRFLPYTTRSRLPKAPWLVRLYLRFPMAWRVLGAQFLIRARKS